MQRNFCRLCCQSQKLAPYTVTLTPTDSVWESAMEGVNDRISDALPEKASEDSETSDEREEESHDEKAKRVDEDRKVSSDYALGNSSEVESRASDSQTLASLDLLAGDSRTDFDDSSDHLSEVQVMYWLQPLQLGGEMEDQEKAVQNEVSKHIGGKSSPSAMKSTTSSTSSKTPGLKMRAVENGSTVCIAEQDKHYPKHLSVVPMPRTPDGYNWRKYGQKQVKSPEGSRSYYRCTFSDCYAKKIECSDISNRPLETVYRSHHNHDPPPKLNSVREDRHASSPRPINGSNDSSHLMEHLNDLVPSITSNEHIMGLDETPETKPESSSSDETTGTIRKKQYGDGPESKKRQKGNLISALDSLPKLQKKTKYIVHAVGEVGISGDGYRWCKYGQKMVKGNPHPRNYYRCTSAGCPVRKHIEGAVNNSSSSVITYKGIHDHDTSVPRKHYVQNSGTAVPTSPISLNYVKQKQTS